MNETGTGTIVEQKNPEFTVHMLNDQGKKNAHDIQAAFDNCLNTLKTICEDGRYLSLVKTKLEEASFFAKKAMAIKQVNQQGTVQ